MVEILTIVGFASEGGVASHDTAGPSEKGVAGRPD
jgi:hypothetical protein